MKSFVQILLVAFSFTCVIADRCTISNARAIDEVAEFIAFLELFKISWLIIFIIGKRSLVERDNDLVCTSSEECLSEKRVPFCYNKATYTFRLPDGTTGNFKTGDYTLADGRSGNFYHGPYPRPTKSPATNTCGSSASCTASQTATQISISTSFTSSTAGSSTSTSVASAAPASAGATTTASSATEATPSASKTASANNTKGSLAMGAVAIVAAIIGLLFL